MQMISFLIPTCLLVVTAYNDYGDSRGGGRGRGDERGRFGGGRGIGDEHGRFGPPGGAGGSKPIKCYVAREEDGKLKRPESETVCRSGQCMAWVLSEVSFVKDGCDPHIFRCEKAHL